MIPNHNGRSHLGRCLASLSRQIFRGSTIVVVDNGSTDGSVDLVRSCFPDVVLIAFARNLGYGRAMNAGIDCSSGEFVAFLNNDTEVEADWLSELVECLERHPSAASATSKLIRLDDSQTIDDAGDLLSFSFTAYQRGAGTRDCGQYEEEIQVFSPSGAGSLWRRSALDRIGLLDESFFAYYEDVDLGFRARLAGYECWYAPRAAVRHAGSATSRRVGEFVYFHSVRNRWSMIVKNVPAALLVKCAPRILARDLLTVARCLRHGHQRHVWRAYRVTAASLRPLLEKRRTVQAVRLLSARDLEDTMRALPQPRTLRLLPPLTRLFP